MPSNGSSNNAIQSSPFIYDVSLEETGSTDDASLHSDVRHAHSNLFTQSSDGMYTRASAAERETQKTLKSLVLVVAEHNTLLKSLIDLMTKDRNDLDLMGQSSSVSDPNSDEPDMRRPLQSPSSSSDNSFRFRTPSRYPCESGTPRSSFSDSPLSSSNSSPFSSSKNSPSMSTPLANCSINNYQEFRCLSLPKYTRSQLEEFDMLITRSSDSYDEIVRNKFIDAVRKFNPIREGSKQALPALFRQIFQPPTVKSNDPTNDENNRYRQLGKEEKFYIEWLQNMEFFSIIVDETISWSQEFIPVVRPNNTRKTATDEIMKVWNKKDHRGKIHANLQSWLRTVRILYDRRCSSKKDNSCTDNDSTSVCGGKRNNASSSNLEESTSQQPDKIPRLDANDRSVDQPDVILSSVQEVNAPPDGRVSYNEDSVQGNIDPELREALKTHEAVSVLLLDDHGTQTR